MKLDRKLDKILLIVTVFLVSMISMTAVMRGLNNKTYADSEIYEEAEEHFVTFYDKGEKLTIKTTAATVGEALKKSGLDVAETDIVDPGLDTAINSNNFFINIYRSRPAMVKDGAFETYVMTASYDPKTIAKEAGLMVYDGDEIALTQNRNFLETGPVEMYVLTRNGGREVTVETEVAFDEIEVKDYNLTPGQREVRTLGEVGLRRQVFEVMYMDGVEVSREMLSEAMVREPVARVVAVGASEIERRPLTAAMGRNRYTVRLGDGTVVERQETYYDLPMSGVMGYCGASSYNVREDGAKVDPDGYVLVAAELTRYPRCSVVETSLGLGKVYDTGSFALENPEQFDLATDWSNHDGR